jgi:hypothetical protein
LSQLRRVHPQAVIGVLAALAVVSASIALAVGVPPARDLAGEPSVDATAPDGASAATFTPGANFNWYREQYGTPLPDDDNGAALWTLLLELADASNRSWADPASPIFDSMELSGERLARLADPSAKGQWLFVRTRGPLRGLPVDEGAIETRRPVADSALPFMRVATGSRDLIWWGLPEPLALDGRAIDVLWQAIPGTTARLGGRDAPVSSGVVLAVRETRDGSGLYHFNEAGLSSLRVFPHSLVRIHAREARRRLALITPFDLEPPIDSRGLPRGVATLEAIVAQCERGLGIDVPEKASLEYQVDPADVAQWRASLASSMRRALDLLLGLPADGVPAIKRLQWLASRKALGD